MNSRVADIPGLRRRKLASMGVYALAGALLVGVTAGSAILVKEISVAPALVALETVDAGEIVPVAQSSMTPESGHGPVEPATAQEIAEVDALAENADVQATVVTAVAPTEAPDETFDPQTRWFNGKAARPSKTIRMRVTGYSPDERSCPGTADGLTATMHSVTTNDHKLVAADTRLLPFGSMVSIPGYDSGQIVPVLDRGGAIKGKRIDLLFPTHEEAIRWGSRWVDVVVWEYVEGNPIDNPRVLR